MLIVSSNKQQAEPSAQIFELLREYCTKSKKKMDPWRVDENWLWQQAAQIIIIDLLHLASRVLVNSAPKGMCFICRQT